MVRRREGVGRAESFRVVHPLGVPSVILLGLENKKWFSAFCSMPLPKIFEWGGGRCFRSRTTLESSLKFRGREKGMDQGDGTSEFESVIRLDIVTVFRAHLLSLLLVDGREKALRRGNT